MSRVASYRAAMQLTRRRIISVAMTLIERDGAEAFSMASLATELGCSVIVLYGHVWSRSELLDGVADKILAQVAAAGLPPCGWEDQVKGLADAMRQVARTSPRCATLAFGRRPLTPAAAAPVVTALRHAGLGEQDAARVAGTLTAYVIGSVLRELGSADAGADFEFGLAMLISAVDGLRAAAGGPDSAQPAGAADLAAPAPAASNSASTAGTTSAADRPAALAIPPMSTGPPSMPA